MTYSPRFHYTDRIVRDLMRIEGARAVVDVLPLPPDVGLRLRQEARQRSTHHSTRIEGNRLRETAIPSAVLHPLKKRTPDEVEVRSYWRALEWIELQCEREPAVIDEDTFRMLHPIIYPPSSGRPPVKDPYRTEEVGVIDQRKGDYEYMAPEPKDVPKLMQDLAAWVEGDPARALPAPIRAAILAYQFVTIHPFMDGNGREARALATMELWRSGYMMRGFLSMEEYYTRNIERYYAMLQMGHPANYYQGRHNPDLTPWIEYFCELLAEAASAVRIQAESLYRHHPIAAPYPWESLSRLQQQLLSRSLALAVEGTIPPVFKPADVADWFGVHAKTATEWLRQWHGEEFVLPASGEERIRSWKLAAKWEELVVRAAEAVRLRESHKEGENDANKS